MTSQPYKYYVYVIVDTNKVGSYKYDEVELEYEPFYVGRGSGSRIKETLYDKNVFKTNKIKKLNGNYEVKIVYDKLNYLSSIEIEKKLISLIGRRDLGLGTLVNLTDGGEGRINSKHSKEVRDKISKTYRSKNLRWEHSEETKYKMSIIQSGKNNGFYNMKHTEENKNKQSELIRGSKHPMYNKKHDEETISLMREKRNRKEVNEKIKESCQKFNKVVLAYDLDMNFLCEYESVKQASEELGINESLISKCCRGDIKKPTRYFFKYKNEEDKYKNNKFLIEEGEVFSCYQKKYRLIKRMKKTCLCENLESGLEENIHIDDFKYLFWKEKNNSDIIELYNFLLKNNDKKTKLLDNYIDCGDFVVYFNKLVSSSEIFLEKNEIFDRYSVDGKMVINIFEDEWENKKDIIKGRLKNMFGKSKRIYARKCTIVEMDKKYNPMIREFLNENHLQGFVGSSVKLGLFYEDELVSIMTFGPLRKNMGQKSKEGAYELLRFCSKLGTTTIGGASKLFKYFIKNYNPNYLLSYSDRRWSRGDLYNNLGFKLSNNNVIPNYFYIVNNKREGRFKYRKNRLIEQGYDGNMTEIQIQHSRGLYRIFDCGSNKHELFFD